MDFRTVYHGLLDFFPQVDSRLLRAVALEYPTNADAAVEVLLSEILPIFESGPAVSRLNSVSNPRSEDPHPNAFVLSDGEVEREESSDALIRRSARLQNAVGSSSEVRSITGEESKANDLTVAPDTGSIFPGKNVNRPASLSGDACFDTVQLPRSIDSEELILFGCPQCQLEHVGSILAEKDLSTNSTHELNSALSQECANTESEGPTSTVKCQDLNPKARDEQTALITETNSEMGSVTDNDLLDLHHIEGNEFGSSVTYDSDVFPEDKSPREEPSSDFFASEAENYMVQGTPGSAEGGLPSECCSTNLDDSESISSTHQTTVEFLEETVEAAKNYKKTLFSTMDSLADMMRQVELGEEAAVRAKKEASMEGLDILVVAEELKETLVHTKDTLLMYAGEVYGEKAIIATEVKELQARLVSLSDERDNSLAILHQMHKELEARLAASEELIKEAEREKLEKIEHSRSAYEQVKILLDKVLHESSIMSQEAEENSKLRSYLMDCGRVVDALQGEMSVVCQDVRLLKEKFDKGIFRQGRKVASYPLRLLPR